MLILRVTRSVAISEGGARHGRPAIGRAQAIGEQAHELPRRRRLVLAEVVRLAEGAGVAEQPGQGDLAGGQGRDQGALRDPIGATARSYLRPSREPVQRRTCRERWALGA